MYELVWPPQMLDHLADIWVAASPDDRDQIGAGVERLNRELRRDPFEVGEEREDPVRVAFVTDVAIYYTVIAYAVRVIHVRRRGE